MARKPKTQWVGARVEEDFSEVVQEYTDATDMTTAQLIRASIKEYIFAHPARNSAGDLQPINPNK